LASGADELIDLAVGGPEQVLRHHAADDQIPRPAEVSYLVLTESAHDAMHP